MPSKNYRTFERAMRRRKPMFCMYRGHPRELCPVLLGHSRDGEEKALTFQFAGGSGSGLPRGGEWRCLSLAQVAAAELREGPWVAGSSHTQPQGCVDIVELDVNPDSPYEPRRSFGKAQPDPKR
jgi:hypothetical protein